VIATLLVTILVEGMAVIVYCVWRRKPLLSILLTGVFGNLLTQSILWIVLTLSFRHFLVALLIAEILVWGIESLLFYVIPANQLKLKEAAFISLGMNGISLLLGWFLPV
jgi:hypothetical protein